jgi:hypothetical protein
MQLLFFSNGSSSDSTSIVSTKKTSSKKSINGKQKNKKTPTGNTVSLELIKDQWIKNINDTSSNYTQILLNPIFVGKH